ncbi:MAG: hypothetical protein AAGG50_11445 [Bacteroidota bacterium]
MRSEFDPLRSTPLPDSFERTAAWLRETPPPRTRRVPVATLVAVALVIGAWSWPVRTTVAEGSVIEILSADRIGAGHPTLVALDRLVPDEHQHFVEVARVGDQGSEGTVLRYTVLGADGEAAERWRDAVTALPGTEAARVLKLDVRKRRSFGVVTVRRALGARSAPHLSDAALQAELDRLFSDIIPITFTVRRSADGQRVLDVEGQQGAVTLRSRAFTLRRDTVASDSLASDSLTSDGRSERAAVSLSDRQAVKIAIDSLPPEVLRALRDRLDANFFHVDSLPTGTAADSLSQIIADLRSDLPRDSLPPAAQRDTVLRFFRIYTFPDSQ